MKELAPIVIFVYSRPIHTEKLLNSLKENILANESEIFIFSDSAKNEAKIADVNEVRKVIHKYENNNYFKKVTIYEATENKGLAKSVIEGVSKIINKYGKVIVLEDDLILSKSFLKYMNEALNVYNDNSLIWSISGYNLPIKISKDYKKDVYLNYRGCSWGWATWKNRWDKVDWSVSDYNSFKYNFKKRKNFNRGGEDLSQMLDAQMNGRCDSWAIRWCYEQSKLDMYTVYPVKSLVTNYGLDGSGTHSGKTTKYYVKAYDIVPELGNDLTLNKEICKKFKRFNSKPKMYIIEILILFRLDKVIEKLRKGKNGRH